jgi:hypothetical protein
MPLHDFFTTTRSHLRNFVKRWDFGPAGLSLTLNKFAQFFKTYLFRKYRKKALLIGINDSGDSGNLLALAGPHRDVQALQQLIIRSHNQSFREFYQADY